MRVELRKLEPFRALRLFRAGKLDEAPVPLGDIRATKLDPQLAPALRVRRLLAADAVIFDRSIPRKLRQVYDDTADRADYQALVPEFEAPPAEDLRHRGKPSASQAAIALRDAKQRIPSLPKRAVGFTPGSDPTLAYGTNLLVAAWRDLGLGAHVGGDDAQLVRLAAAYPKLSALTLYGRGERPGPDRLGRRRPPRLAPPARLARGRARLGRLRRGQTPGPEPTPVTSKRAVATAGESSPVG